MSDIPCWYKLKQQPDGAWEVELQTGPNRYWAPGVISANPLPFGDFSGKRVRVTGPAPGWMYAHVGAGLGAAGVEPEYEALSQQGTSADPSDCVHSLKREGFGQRGRAFLRVDARQDRKPAWPVIESCLQAAFDSLLVDRPYELVVTGIMGNRGYLRLGYLSGRLGLRRLVVLQPNAGMVLVHHAPEPAGECWAPGQVELGLVGQSGPGLVVGIIGDPNQGKSVLSAVLNQHRIRNGQQGWRLDCDGQSPTPAWYLNLHRSDPASAERVRGAPGFKRDWTHEMEKDLARQLELLRSFYPVALADLPGGIHPKAGSDKPVQRVPDGREVIFREVDRFILVDSEMKQSESGWLEALGRHGLAGRLAAVVLSADPGAEGSMEVDPKGNGGAVLRLKATGLDRRHDPADLAIRMAPALGTLWDHVVGTSRPRGNPVP